MSHALSIETKVPLLNSDVRIPQLGFGVYQSSEDKCKASCLAALKAGYRHIDTAQFYANEKQVGQALKESGLSRSDVFVTTKILAAGATPEKTYKKCLDSVSLIDGEDGYIDLFLIHSPHSGPAKVQEMWQALERLQSEGRVKSIGVSNFSKDHIEAMKGYATVWPPPVNQIELHPWCRQGPTVKYCKEAGIVLEAYSPLTRMSKTDNEELVGIAKAHNKTAAQVLIRYCLQQGWVPLPKSDTPERIQANADVFDFDLTEKEMKVLHDRDPKEESHGALVEKVA